MTRIHGLVGTQFGDLEYDVGKSVRWTQYFADTMFILDINLGNTRYYVVDWKNTFPQAESRVAAIDYFTKPVEWRKKQYELAKSIWKIEPDDWVLFVDGHEGLNIDTRIDPPGWAEEPFQSYITAVIDAATGPTVSLPLIVYLSDGDIYPVEYTNTAPPDPNDPDAVPTPFVSGADASIPYYMDDDSGSLVRLIKASELEKPDFDWTVIDQLGAVGSADTTDISIISYGYAHWHLEDIAAGQPMQPVYLDATVGTATLPDPGVMPTEFTFIVDAEPFDPLGDSKAIASQFGGGGSWIFGGSGVDFVMTLQTAGGQIYLGGGGGLTPERATYACSATLNDGAGHSRMTIRRLEPDGTWSSLGSNQAAVAVILDSPDVVRIGAVFTNSYLYDEPIYFVELRTGLDPTAGTVLWRFDAEDYPGTGTSYVDPRGQTWTLTNAAAIPPPKQPTTPPMTAANDDGWRMRNMLSKVRPIPGLPIGTWQEPTEDPAGVAGPDLSTHIYGNPGIDTGPPPGPANEVATLLTPLYDAVFRFGLRDGLVWKGQDGTNTLGNIPMSWDYTLEQWVPRMAPEQWVDERYPQGA